ncbi:MAG TPA: hypothetical protein VLL31_00700 [Sulfurovum sp.]|nr:hypothetical protein [Sulfurovum sp.]
MSHHKEKYENFIWVLSVVNEMIDETMYHTQTFAHALRLHDNEKAAKVFFLAFEQFKAEKVIVAKHTQNSDLQTIPPWEIPFPEYQHPSSHLTDVHYQMTETEAIKAIERMIGAHQTFYECLLKESRAEKVISCVDLLLKHHVQWK